MRKTIRPSNYTFTKRGVYYFSRRIPEDLQHHYKRPRIVRSLRTKQPKEAATAAQLLSSQLDQLWFQLRLQKQTEQLSSLSQFQRQSSQFTLEQALAYYLEQKGKTRSRLFHKHAMLYVSYLQTAVPHKTKLNDFTTRDALAFRTWLQDKGLSNASVHKSFATIRAIFNFVIQEHALDFRNVFKGMQLPSEKDDAKKRLPIAIADIRLIQSRCKAVDDDMRWLVALISDTGMRLSEAAGLMLNDLSLDEDIPHIVIQPHKHRPLKTRSSERIVPLVGASLWAAQRIKQNAQVSAYCFPRYCNAKGCNANSASAALNKWLKSVTKSKDYVLHGLRHSFRDRLRAVDAPIEMIDRLGGWSLKTVGQDYGNGYQLEQMHLTMKMLCTNILYTPTETSSQTRA